MEEKQGYDVLKIVVHSDRCYMSTDYIRGKPLILWLKYHPQIEKERLYRWMRGLLDELEHFHRCRGNPCYQYVNPYSIIVGEDEKLHLLDLGSKEQDEMLHVMQRRNVREHFLSPENQYYQKVSVQEDIYGFGKTLQYVLSVIEVEPALGRLEEARFQKIISRCLNQNSKKNYQTIQELSEHFPNKKKTKESRKPLAGKMLVCAAVLMGAAALGMQFAGDQKSERERKRGEEISGKLSDTEGNNGKSSADYREEMQQKQEQWNEEKQEIEEAAYEREKELTYELALLYFVELEDYQKSKEVMETVGQSEKFAEDFIKLCELMDGQAPFATKQDMEQLLEQLEAELPASEDERYIGCITRGRQLLQNEEVPEEGASSEEAEGAQDTDGNNE